MTFLAAISPGPGARLNLPPRSRAGVIARDLSAAPRSAAKASPRKIGLTPEQLLRVKAILNADLETNVRLEVLAQHCHLSTRHFSRAFRASTGTTPHRWLIERRLETAKGLILCGVMSLSEIALFCGFSDQSHLTRSFCRAYGAAPGLWAKQHRLAVACAA